MAFSKFTLTCCLAVVTCCLSVSAVPSKQRTQAQNSSPAKNAHHHHHHQQQQQQQVANEAKPDFVPIFLYSRENSLDGDYNYKYETGNGIFVEERGVMTNKGTEDEANAVVGSYKYVSPEGVPIEVTYTAGVDGFRAYGAHLPVGPSAAHLPKSLSYNKNAAAAAAAAAARPQLRSADADSPAPAYYAASPPSVPDVGSASSQNRFAATTAPETGSFEPSGGRATAANDVPPEQHTQILFVDGDGAAGVRGPTEKPPAPFRDAAVRATTVAEPTAAAAAQGRPQQDPAQVDRYRQQFSPQDNSVVPVLQTVPQNARTQPRVVPILQRVVPVPGYQLQQQQPLQLQPQLQQQQQRQVPPPGFNRQHYPFSRFGVEPQQMWYVQPHNQHGRYFQTPHALRTLEPPKY